jgi:carboxymethylenebutenolidase
MRTQLVPSAVFALTMLSACSARRVDTDEHAQHEAGAAVVSSSSSVQQGASSLPASSATVKERLERSPRHAEWAMIRTGGDSVRAWVVYPERRDKAPVVVVIHEIFGLSAWVRGVADQLAADGYIAIAPDLLTGKAPMDGDSVTAAAARSAIQTLKPDDVHRQLAAVGKYGMSLPAAQQKYGIVGFCWGGATSFAHAVRSPEGLTAAVVYYGGSPATAELSRVKAPVLGLYGGMDNRVNSTIPAADSAMKTMGKIYEPNIFEGAGHGFLRAQGTGENAAIAAANVTATQRAWPLTIAFFRKHLGA